MITYEEALNIVQDAAKKFSLECPGEEFIPLDNTLGRVLAVNIIADRDYPPFNRAAMDGYAIQLQDWESGIRSFQIAEVIFAGQQAINTLSKGTCYKIMTGAAVPLAANCVVRREDTLEKEREVQINVETLKMFQNIARQGEDTKEGEIIVNAPTKCTPSIVSVLAATGHPSVCVKKLPRVAIFTTGNEVVNIKASLSPVQIRNSNQHLLTALLQKWLITPVISQHLPDEQKEIRNAIEAALQNDIIILSGGVSAGDADFVPEILKSLGIRKLFYKVAIRPGKPIWCGQMPEGGIVFALPGNPFSCLVTFTLFVESFLHYFFYLEERAVFNHTLNTSRSKKHPLTEFFPVKMENCPQSGLSGIQFNGSGDIKAGLLADGLGIHPSGSEDILKGDIINFIPFV